MTAADARELTRGVLQLIGLGLYLAGLAVGGLLMGIASEPEKPNA